MGSQRVRCNLATKQQHIIKIGFSSLGKWCFNNRLSTVQKKKKAYLDLTKKYETTVLRSSNYEINGNPRQYSCLENPMDRGAWQATVHGVTRVGHDLATKLPPPPPRSAGHWNGRQTHNSALNGAQPWQEHQRQRAGYVEKFTGDVEAQPSDPGSTRSEGSPMALPPRGLPHPRLSLWPSTKLEAQGLLSIST